MQKWEYTWIHVNIDSIINQKRNTKEFTDGMTASKYIDSLGRNGWELVNVTRSGSIGVGGSLFHIYWFKRPIS